MNQPTELTKRIRLIPHNPGVYLMRDSSNEILYIGKASDLAKRVTSYFVRSHSDYRITVMLNSVAMVNYIVTNSEKEALLLEQKLIKKYQPRYNVNWRDDKSYPMLKLTLNDEFPRLFLTRQIKHNGARYFGPYPKVAVVRKLLRLVRSIFPLRVCKQSINSANLPNIKKVQSCLYYHIKECVAPCMNKISVEEYNSVVNKVILFLEGKYNELTNLWNKEMQTAVSNLEFEKAAKLRDSIFAINHLTERVRFQRIREEDLQKRIEFSQTLNELQKLLKLPRLPLRIECFDISNIQGKQAVGAMVTFDQGKPAKNLYRRFRIKTVDQINDYAMLQEIVRRRYRSMIETKGALPDLILIDGGKGQLSAVRQVLNSLRLNDQSVVSLAKKNEEVFVPGKENSVLINQDSPALQYLRQIRDESHRFAISYHRYLRKKNFVSE